MPGTRSNIYVTDRVRRYSCLESWYPISLSCQPRLSDWPTGAPCLIASSVRVARELHQSSQPRGESAFCCLPCCPIPRYAEGMCAISPRIKFDREEPSYFPPFTHRHVSARRKAGVMVVFLAWNGKFGPRLPSTLPSNPCASAASISYYSPKKFYSS